MKYTALIYLLALLKTFVCFAEDYRLEIRRLKNDAWVIPELIETNVLGSTIRMNRIAPMGLVGLAPMVILPDRAPDIRRHQELISRLQGKSSFYRSGLFSSEILSKLALILHLRKMEAMANLMEDVHHYHDSSCENRYLNRFFLNKRILSSVNNCIKYLRYLSEKGFLEVYPTPEVLKTMLKNTSKPFGSKAYFEKIARASAEILPDYDVEVEKNEVLEDDTCGICTNFYDKVHRIAKHFPRKHHACAICINSFRKNVCHLCRHPIYEERIDNL